LTIISDLTYKVVAFSEIPDFNTDESVDWAFEMVELGYNTPSLLMLAGLTKPTNYFHAIEYLKAALQELNLEVKFGKEAIISYGSFYITKIAAGNEVKRNLEEVYILNQSLDHEKTLYDFSTLHWAWGDLDYRDDYQYYWEGANKGNIKAIVIDSAKKWLEENREHYAQHNIVKIQA
jgi:hypothetical protein